jgi:hypothetical protein
MAKVTMTVEDKEDGQIFFEMQSDPIFVLEKDEDLTPAQRTAIEFYLMLNPLQPSDVKE